MTSWAAQPPDDEKHTKKSVNVTKEFVAKSRPNKRLGATDEDREGYYR